MAANDVGARRNVLEVNFFAGLCLCIIGILVVNRFMNNLGREECEFRLRQSLLREKSFGFPKKLLVVRAPLSDGRKSGRKRSIANLFVP